MNSRASVTGWLLLAFTAAAAAAAQTMSAAEQDALFEVMESMAGVGGRSWRQSHPEPCVSDMWQGLECEQRSDDGLFHVTGLSFGTKPNPQCSANATLPYAITNLRWLQSLRISACFLLSSAPNATIPAFLRHFPALIELSIRSNAALSGEIPPELSSIATLQILSLSQNSITGSIPAELANLRSLQRLDLSDNRLSGGVPPSLGGAAALVILDLSSNALTGSIPASLANLTRLQKLDLSLNSLSGAIPAALAAISALQFLALDHNRLSGPIPAPLFGGAASLQYLILDANPINATLPPFEGVGLQSLVVVSAAGCGLYGEIPASVAALKNLTVLSLQGNGLTGNIPAELADLRHLYQLNLSNNSLSGAIPFTSDFVARLGRGIDLSGNAKLCSHWSIDATISAMSGVGACSDPKYTAFLTSDAGVAAAAPLLLLLCVMISAASAAELRRS